MIELLGITPMEALAVVLGTVGMYVAMVVLARLLGQRMLASMSTFDIAAVVAFGSIIGRASLGEFPRLAAGLIALPTLIVLQAAAGQLRLTSFGQRLVMTRPVLLMAGDRILEENMRRCHLIPSELQSRLRQAGIRHSGEVAAVVFESSGTISVIRRGEAIDPQLLSGVHGASLVPQTLLR